MATNAIYPSLAYINALTNAQNAVLTFTANHDFTVGEIVTFRISKDFGTYQLNQLRGKVLAVTSDTITVDVDTLDMDVFDYSALNTAGTTPPVCLPVSSGIIPDTNPTAINIDCAFDNRSA